MNCLGMKRAFTGAIVKVGRLELPDRHAVPRRWAMFAEVQPKLLRALQEREFSASAAPVQTERCTAGGRHQPT